MALIEHDLAIAVTQQPHAVYVGYSSCVRRTLVNETRENSHSDHISCILVVTFARRLDLGVTVIFVDVAKRAIPTHHLICTSIDFFIMIVKKVQGVNLKVRLMLLDVHEYSAEMFVIRYAF